MKTTIYELLGMIKDNKAPKKIMYGGDTYTYCEEEKDYVSDENDSFSIFQDMVISKILNEEVEILETTITYKQDDYIQYQPYTGEFNFKPQEPTLYEPYTPSKDDISKLPYYDYSDLNMEIITQEEYFRRELQHIEIRLNDYHEKINKIIDKLNKEVN